MADHARCQRQERLTKQAVGAAPFLAGIRYSSAGRLWHTFGPSCPCRQAAARAARVTELSDVHNPYSPRQTPDVSRNKTGLKSSDPFIPESLEHMISFNTASHRFHLRAAAVLIHNGSILLHRAEGDGFWALPGGRVEAGEHAAAAVARELHEELSISATIGELLFLVENFFTHQGKNHHEVGLYFAAEAEPGCRLLASGGPYEGIEGNRKLTFAWFSLSHLGQIEIRPSFLASALTTQKIQFTHIVHQGENPP